jgi:uncharacterized protein
MLKSIKLDLPALIGNSAALASIRPADFVDDQFGLPTVTDILAELDKPGRDPRPAFTTATFREGVEKISDLEPGMTLEGVVTNVAAFGAFIDVGVHQDGLAHVSALSNRFVKDPREVVKPGDVVTCKVLDVDVPRKRISLTLRLDNEPTRGGAADRGDRRGGDRGQGRQGQDGHAQGRQGQGRQGQGRQGQGRQGQGGPGAGRPQRNDPSVDSAMADALRRAGFTG